MRKGYFLPISAFLWIAPVKALPMWEAGDLTYSNGETEISAFINTQSSTQVQSVMCTRNSAYSYRFSLLLPTASKAELVIQVTIKSDNIERSVYAELSGNSIDFQIDQDLMMSIPEAPNFTLIFDKEDAEYLGIPRVMDIPMTGADMTFRKVASECTVLCINSKFQCNIPMVSSILWPKDNFKNATRSDIDDLCTEKSADGRYKFRFSDSCKVVLDRFYKKEGTGPLSFLNRMFNDSSSLFKKYESKWNEAVDKSPTINDLNSSIYAEGQEWYLLLYSLAGTHRISEFPQAYHEILNFKDDPTTLIYDIDNRYEIETLKYSSVLYRRSKSSVQSISAIEQALKYWSDFYREFQAALPPIKKIQAIRPVIYRSMLMRVWKLAGRPQGLVLNPKNAFRQGTGGRTLTGEDLEAKCSFFDGVNGEQFYFASDACIKDIYSHLRTDGFKTQDFSDVERAWDKFAKAWGRSIFFNDSIDDAVGEHPRSNLGLAVISLFRLYGFGDYFLLNECISSRDADICSYEESKAFTSYSKELQNRINAIASVSPEDAKTLNKLNELWLDYHQALSVYTEDLVARGKIPLWRAKFVMGVANTVQTNALLHFMYDREELPDISLDDVDSDGDNIDIEAEGSEDDF